MSDKWVAMLAVGAAVGAWSGFGLAVPVAVAFVVVAFVVRRPWVLCLAVLVLAGTRSAADERGLHGSPPGSFDGWATAVTDPVTDASGATSLEVVVEGAHVLATARDAPAVALIGRAAGDRLLLSGRLSPVPVDLDGLGRRHISARMTVSALGGWADGFVPYRWANAARDALDRSAAVLPERQRGLYLGLVLGDDRTEPADIADDFRGAGLSHLLAVSGQNVAFALALVAPVLQRSPLRVRLGITLAVLFLFVLATRAEPSVLRAGAMAGTAAVAAALGREASGVRILGLAVTGLLLVDPFLAHSLGFELSVAASAAILTLSRPIAARVPGPPVLAEAVSVSIAAQIGVAPILVGAFGGVPVAGLLANVLAAPAAGPVMAWGIVAGLAGGVLGPAAATVLHLPTRVFVWWLAAVARWAAGLPLGELGARELVALVAAFGVVAVARRTRFAPLVALGLALAALVAPAYALRAPPPLTIALGSGAVLWRDGGSVLVIDGRARATTVLSGLREAGVGGVDLLVVRTSSSAAAAVADAVVARGDVGEQVGPELASASERLVGRLRVKITPGESSLVVEVVDDG